MIHGSCSELTASLSLRARLQAYFSLTKPRLSAMSVLTALVGYMLADPQRSTFALVGLLIGTSLTAGGAAALNQWLERHYDSLMVRTRARPLVVGSVDPAAALVFGLALSLAGFIVLYVYTHPFAAWLAALTIVLYVMVYTPLKRYSIWNTHLGAIPGALPPLIGWAAARGEISGLGLVLFSILFAWQIPHFMAIAWMHREDYARAGMKMIPVYEPTGRRAGIEAIVFSLVMLCMSLLPCLQQTATLVYGVCAAVVGIWMTVCSVRFLAASIDVKTASARRLFFASIMYLPFLLLSLVLDHWLLA
jgi:heme o synthase